MMLKHGVILEEQLLQIVTSIIPIKMMYLIARC